MGLGNVDSAIAAWAAREGVAVQVRQVQLAEDGVVVLATLISDDSGAEALLSVSPDGTVSIIDMDSHLQLEEQVRLLGAPGLALAQPCNSDPRQVAGVPPDPAIPDNLDAAGRIAFVARAFLDRLSSRNAPCTDRGNLACAWAVNHVVNVATGRPIGPVASMLATKEIFRKLSSGFAQQVALDIAGAGDVVISPTDGKIGHVGILIDSERICSNSSRAALWKQNFTKQSWVASYEGNKNLLVRAFRLH